jgi:hypothetical protein
LWIWVRRIFGAALGFCEEEEEVVSFLT